MHALLPSLLAVGLVSAISLAGAFLLLLGRRGIERTWIGLALISFAAGALLGDAFLHLIPEAAEDGLDIWASIALLSGVVGFFVLEKVLHWHHAHVPHDEVIHPVAWTNLVGDGLHNFVDGALIAGSFLVSPTLGVTTAIAVALHELPQEMGDFSILLHAGLKPRRALALNALTALVAIAGAVVALLLAGIVEGMERILVPATAGGFVYIASTDLLPELQKEPDARKSAIQLAGLLGGIGVMAALLLLE